jgi:hypothetical protein
MEVVEPCRCLQAPAARGLRVQPPRDLLPAYQAAAALHRRRVRRRLSAGAARQVRRGPRRCGAGSAFPSGARGGAAEAAAQRQHVAGPVVPPARRGGTRRRRDLCAEVRGALPAGLYQL